MDVRANRFETALLITAILVSSGCSDDPSTVIDTSQPLATPVATDGPPPSTPTTSDLPTTSIVPVTSDEESSDNIPYEQLPQLDVGDVSSVQVWSWCGVHIAIANENYFADREIAPYPGRDWMTSDFPPNWDVVVFNDAPQDGPNWVILDATAERIDNFTVEVTDRDGVLIAYFELDTTPPGNRISC